GARTGVARTAWPSRLLRAEPLLILLLVPLAWWPGPATPVGFLLIPAFWILRRCLRGRWSVPTPFDLPAIGLLLWLPVLVLVLSSGPPLPSPGTPTLAAADAQAGPLVLRRGQPVGPQAYDYHDVNQGTLSLRVMPLGWAGDDGDTHVITSQLYKYNDNQL